MRRILILITFFAMRPLFVIENASAHRLCSRKLIAGQKSVILKKYEPHWIKTYLPTTGYQSILDFRKAVQAEKKAKKLLPIINKLKNETVWPIIFSHPEDRSRISKSGFKNIYQTGQSSMSLTVENERAVAEASMLDLSLSEYNKIPNVEKLKSGMLVSTLADIFQQHQNIPEYGSDAYIFNLDQVRDQLTLTPGDSLNRSTRAIRSGDDFKIAQVPGVKYEKDSILSDSLRDGKTVRFPIWDLHFVPWDYRELIAPFLSQTKKESTFCLSRDDMYECPPALVGFYKSLDPRNSYIPKDLRVSFPEPRSQYIEIQFWGEIGIDQAKGFVFFEEAPSGKFLDELLKKRVKIYDGRNGVPRLFNSRSTE